MSRKNSNDWKSATWTGARREQLRRWSRLSLREKVQAVEEMGKLAERFAKNAPGKGSKKLTRFEKVLEI